MGIFDQGKNRFVSHRGFQPLAPANSLPSFYYAGLLGQWAIETDLHLTRDGEIVCCHNDAVDTYCAGTGKISEMTYAELLRLPLINRVECFSDADRRIPKFSEYLEICRRFGSVPFIELKTDDAEAVFAYMRRCGFEDGEIVMSSARLARLEECRRVSKTAFIHWIFGKEEGLERLASLGNAGLSWKIADPFECPAEKISLAHGMGLKVCLRAADDLRSLARMQELGLDYVPTNTLHEEKLSK